MSVVKKSAVTINVSLDPLVKNMRDSARVECGGKLCAISVLNTMHRPQDLFDAVENNVVACLFTWMTRRETAVVWWVPVLRGKNQLKAPLQFIGERDDFITLRHRQRAAGQKIILK